MVYSGFRFVEHAHKRGKPVVAINLGRIRADHLLAAKAQQDCDELPRRLQGSAYPIHFPLPFERFAI